MSDPAVNWEPLELEIDWEAESPTALDPASATIPIAPRPPSIEDVFAFEPLQNDLRGLEWVDDLDEEAIYPQESPTQAETPAAKSPTMRAAPPPPATPKDGPVSIRITVPSLRSPRLVPSERAEPIRESQVVESPRAEGCSGTLRAG